MIRERQSEGIKIAKQNGKYKGRPVKYSPHSRKKADVVMYNTIVSMLKKKDSVMDIHKETDVSRNTIYRIKEELGISSERNDN